MTRRKVLFVINSLAGGGAERVFCTIVGASGERLASHGVEVALLDDEKEVYLLPDGVRVHRLATGGGLVGSIKRLDSLVANMKPDLILSFLTRANVATVIAARRHGAKAVLSERINTSAHLATGRFAAISKFLVRLTYKRAGHIITVSDGVTETLAKDFSVPKERMTAIPNPVDAASIRTAATDAPAIKVRDTDVALMGRLRPNKNFALAIRAFAASQWQGRLLLLGEGPDHDMLVKLGDSLGLGDRLIMPGFVANPYAVIARAGLFILPSRAEGFSNALVEAMATGTAVISTDCPSGPSLIMEKYGPITRGIPVEATGGYLVQMDDVEAMTAAIDSMRDDAARKAFADAGFQRVEAFSVARATEAYWKVIDDMLERHQP